MTKDTNTSTASGAAIQRYKIGYHTDEWGQRSSTPSGTPDASGSWVRYADHIATLAAGQATAAPAGGVVAYLDIGAGGYLDLGSDLSNEAISRLPKGRHALIVAGTYGIDGYTPTPPAPAQPVPPNAITASVMRDDGGEAPAFCLMAAYRSEKDAMDAFALIAAAPAQPAAQQGAAYAALPTSNYAGRVYEEGFLIGTCPLYTADQLRAFADATHALRVESLAAAYCEELDKFSQRNYEMRLASHGQAPAGATLPDGWVPLTITHEGQYPEEVAYGPQIMMDRLGKWLGKYFAQAAEADSVQEDVARLDFLIDQGAYVVSDPDTCTGHWLHWARPDGSTRVQGDEHPTPRAAIDAAMNKGGAT